MAGISEDGVGGRQCAGALILAFLQYALSGRHAHTRSVIVVVSEGMELEFSGVCHHGMGQLGLDIVSNVVLVWIRITISNSQVSDF